jgi:nucleotide-binding universal stress UspA family protein
MGHGYFHNFVPLKVEIIMSDSKPIILVPTGFSEHSLTAVEQASIYAGNLKAKLVIMSVVEEQKFFSNLLGGDKEKAAEIKDEVKKHLDSLAAKYESKLEVETIIANGTVYEKIVEIAEMMDVDLIVMGTHGAKKGIMSRFIGSNALRVVTSAHCPVITIKGDEIHSSIKNIILPLDLQKETKQKVGRAIEVAKRRDATIHVISVIKSMDEFLVNALRRNFHQVEKIIKESGVGLVSHLIQATNEDNIHDLILGYCDNVNADLIMIMTQQETNISEYFVGSLAQKIIHKSTTPVMSIQPKMGSGDLISSTGSY